MKRITPSEIYEGLPCSVVSVGCALNIAEKRDLDALFSSELHSDGYLSLKGMDALIRRKTQVKRRENFKRGERPALRDFAHSHLGQRAVVCVLGHFLYFDGRDYHSFLWNGGDPVVSVWYLN